MAENTNPQSHDWLSLVGMGGVMVSEPVLQTHFPNGPPQVPSDIERLVNREWVRYRVRVKEGKTETQNRWLTFVFEALMGIKKENWRIHHEVQDSWTHRLFSYMQNLKPNRVLVSGNEAVLSVMVYPHEQKLNRVETKSGKWKASPITKIDRLLRETKVPFGLLTNGTDFILVYSPPGLTTSTVTWSANTWVEEKETLAGFIMIAGQERFLGPEEKLLTTLVQESQKRQADVTDQLGNQVRDSLDLFIRAINDFNRTSPAKPLLDMTEDEMYEMSLSVMMRLVFLLYAEENLLLPHGDFLYDQGYGITHLWTELERTKTLYEEQLLEKKDAWPRLLATFRMIFNGCSHPDLNMRAYGGSLFDPERFKALEKIVLNNKTIYDILFPLLFSKTKVGGEYLNQRVSYRSLDIEQIGSVYEGLMEYKIKTAKEDMVVFKGKYFETRPLNELVQKEGDGLINYLNSMTGWTKNRINKIIEENTQNEGTPFQKFSPFVRDYMLRSGHVFMAYEGAARKGSGSYYTPKQLTSFLVKEALEPLTHDDKGKIKSPREILELTVCDPAMGSGAFLVQAIQYLGERLVESWDFINTSSDKTISIPNGDPLTGENGELNLPVDREEALIWAKRFVVENCIYGVDLNPLAVELAKMSLWLATLSKDRPFTFLDHRLRCGNSLIGAEFSRLNSIPSEPLWREDKKKNNKILKKVTPITDFQISKMLESIIQGRKDLSKHEMSILDVKKKEKLISDLMIEGRNYSKIKKLCDIWCSVWFWPYKEKKNIKKSGNASLSEFGIELEKKENYEENNKEDFSPPHTEKYREILKYLAKGRTDISIEDCNKYLETSSKIVKEQKLFHWELEFPEVFLNKDGSRKKSPGFDAVIGNPPWDKLKPNPKEFFIIYDSKFNKYQGVKARKVREKLLENKEINIKWIQYNNRFENLSKYFKNQYTLQIGGREHNIYRVFIEKFISLINNVGSACFVVPSGFISDDTCTEMRKKLLRENKINFIYVFENKEKIFPIHAQYRFVLARLSMKDPNKKIKYIFGLTNFDQILQNQIKPYSLNIDEIQNINPYSFSFPQIESNKEMEILTKIYKHKTLLGNKKVWKIHFGYDVHNTHHRELFNFEKNGIPVYEGKNIHHYTNQYLPVEKYIEEEKLSKTHNSKDPGNRYRMASREVASSTNETTVISAILPKKSLVMDTIVSQRMYDSELSDDNILYLTSLFNSYLINFVTRKKVMSHVSLYIIHQLPILKFNHKNFFFNQLISRSARLICIYKDFSELWNGVYKSEWKSFYLDDGGTSSLKNWRDIDSKWSDKCGVFGGIDNKKNTGDRAQLRAEIDALIAHLYELTEDDFSNIIGTFPVLKKNEEAAFGEFRSKRMCLEEYRRFAPIIEREKKKNPEAFEIPKYDKETKEDSD